MLSSNHSGRTVDVESQSHDNSNDNQKAELDTLNQDSQQSQKQEVDEKRIEVQEKQEQQQTKMSSLQEKLAPLMLFVVSMAQFIDISKLLGVVLFQYYFLVTLFMESAEKNPSHVPNSLSIPWIPLLIPYLILQ
jgi:hypothetical protein